MRSFVMLVLALFAMSAEGKNRGAVAESVSKRIMQKWHEIDAEIHKRHPLKHIRRVIHH
jgi:hypothetical protein